ncbi:MAG: polysaccharide biosynthesis C-terminal domain-containing protein, partial [Phycisphaerales bacterium]
LWFQGSLSIRDCSIISAVLNLLVIGFIFDRGQAPTAKMLLGTDRQWLNLLISTEKNVLGLLLGYTFMTFTPLGILGMAVGWLTSYFVTGIFIYSYTACRCFKINLFKYFSSVYLRSILASLPLALLSYALSQYFKPSSWLMLTTITTFCAGIHCISIYFICIEKEHQALLVKHIKGWLFSYSKTTSIIQ